MLYHPARRSATAARTASSCQLLTVARAAMTRQRWASMRFDARLCTTLITYHDAATACADAPPRPSIEFWRPTRVYR
jgi:hypothetical protein